MSGDRALAASFRYPGVAVAYAHRPPYPPEVFDVLAGLAAGGPRAALDLGSGDGALARPLAERFDRVDAVDVSPAMIEAGRARPGGRRANLSWFVEPAEELSLPGPYGLVTAGASLHWMDCDTVVRRVGRVLAPGAVLAVVDQTYHELAWDAPLAQVIARYSRHPDYDPEFSLPDELSRRNLLHLTGVYQTSPVTVVASIRDYVEQFHSTASLARELMSPAEAARFDADVEAVVRDFQTDAGLLTLRTVSTITWGRPTPSD